MMECLEEPGYFLNAAQMACTPSGKIPLACGLTLYLADMTIAGKTI